MLYLSHEEGQGLTEYGLILVLIAVVVVIILSLVGTQISTLFSKITSSIPAPLAWRFWVELIQSNKISM